MRHSGGGGAWSRGLSAAGQQLANLVTANGTFDFDTTALSNGGDGTDQSQVTTITFDANSPTILVGAQDAGIISSLDGGTTWARVCGSSEIRRSRLSSFMKAAPTQ